jgi:hypothetical protein
MALSSPKDIDFNDATCQIPSWIFSTVNISSDQLTAEDFELLHHYTTSTWETFAVRGDATTHRFHRDRVPQLSTSQPYLLYALLSVAASHRNSLQPSKQLADRALVYRQKTFQSYTKALQNITLTNYETILTTATFLLALTPPPVAPASDEEHLDWMYSLLKLSEGIRILVSLRWSRGIEKLSIYPLICRELRTLPPPPIIVAPDNPALQTRAGPLGSTPDHPNPASTYDLPQALSFAGFVFLPPPLMALLEHITHPPETGPLDLDCNTLVPVLHVFSPVFLSLYYYHLNPDYNVRIFVFTSFLMPEFLALVKAREPRALVLMAWFFVMANLIPHGWWVNPCIGYVVQALGRAIRQSGDACTVRALDAAEKIYRVCQLYGTERAAEAVFEDWPGVQWDEGPMKATEWELGSLNLDLTDVDLGSLDLHIPA